MKKIVFILLIFCSFLVVWGCNKNKTKCVLQKEATSDSSMRSNDDTLSLMIEHEVDDVDYKTWRQDHSSLRIQIS